MSSNAIAGVGALFKRGDGNGSSEVFTAFAEVNSIDGPTMTREQIDVTSLNSIGGYREYIGGFRDAGEVVLNMNFTRNNYVSLLADFESPDSVNYQIVLPDTGETTLTFAGVVIDLPLSIPTGDKVTVNTTIKITGQVDLDS
jgi:predicted secreted protein